MRSLSLPAWTRRVGGRPALTGISLAGCVALALLLALLLALVLALTSVALDGAAVQAADPTASSPAVVLGGDPRSDGSGPGLVGAPLLVLAAVIALGLCTVTLTVLLARVTRRP